MSEQTRICALCDCTFKSSTFFASLTDDELRLFKDAVITRGFGRGDVVFMEGDECTGLYVVRTGRVKLVSALSTGREHIIKILDAGDLLGLEVFYGGERYEKTAEAMEETELCYIDKGAFARIMEESPAVTRSLVTAMAAELSSAYERIGNLGLLSAREKMANLLYGLAEEYGSKQDGEVRLSLTLSRLEMAELLGITQETGIRLLKSFKDEGIIEIRRKELTIKSLSSLKELAHVG